MPELAEYEKWQSNLALTSHNEAQGWPIPSPEQVHNILTKRAMFKLSVPVFEARFHFVPTQQELARYTIWQE
jgi:hypothetical protein